MIVTSLIIIRGRDYRVAGGPSNGNVRCWSSSVRNTNQLMFFREIIGIYLFLNVQAGGTYWYGKHWALKLLYCTALGELNVVERR